MVNKNSCGSIWRKWDLHIHSDASDGKATPQEIVEKAIEMGLDGIALTDHHTVKNIDAIKEIAKSTNLSVISGVEFRTEYGAHSVHIIGLFPDEHNNVSLNAKALDDLILAPLHISETHLIAKEKISNPNILDEKAFKRGMFSSQVDFKKAADLIHKYGGIVTVHAGEKSNGIETEMKHAGAAPKNVKSLAASLGPLKDELLKEYVDVCELNAMGEDALFYFERWNKPSIIASDAHNKEKIGESFVWIKGDATFNGLKQIIYEPSDRVKIQTPRPEEKRDYHIIDRIEINHPDFGRQSIPLNPNLNTIIGGRSSGKSILIGCIATLASTRVPVKKSEDYQTYINSIAENMRLYWKDNVMDGSRKVEFFPQSYINNLASDSNEIMKILEEILKTNPEKSALFNQHQDFENENRDRIRYEVSMAFSYNHQLTENQKKLQSLGNKNGIINEIDKLKAALDNIKASMCEPVGADGEIYASLQRKIQENNGIINSVRINLDKLSVLKRFNIFNDLGTSLSGFSEELKNRLSNDYRGLVDRTSANWLHTICSYEAEENEKLVNCTKEIADCKNNETFKKYEDYYAKNEMYVSQHKIFEDECSKLRQIESIENEMGTAKIQIEQCKDKILKLQECYFINAKELSEKLSEHRDDVEIVSEVFFKSTEYDTLIEGYLDNRTSANNEIKNYTFENLEGFKVFIASAFDKVLANSVILKANHRVQDFAQNLLTKNHFEIRYDAKYQQDNISSMSEGKKAFIILRMLLDFSTEECPILIDQPEDDLDNRAIYSELVRYVRNKKKERQIIFVTHNPNIVIGADAEEIIVANQNGVGNENQEGVKFEYISGSIENSFRVDGEPTILLRQGIKQHVCDLLEGGDVAFKKRENKYELS